MNLSEPIDVHAEPLTSPARKVLLLAPLAAALAYPYLLNAFHLGFASRNDPTSIARMSLAAICLVGAVAAPVFGLAVAGWLSRVPCHSAFELRARRLAYLTMATPPLFVFVGVSRGLLGGPLSDEVIWVFGWLAAVLLPGSAADRPSSRP
jgi:hypothetical protein